MKYCFRFISFLLLFVLFSLSNAIAKTTKDEDEKAKKDPILEEIRVEATPIVSGLPLDQAASVGSGLNLTLRETPASVDIITKEVMRERGNTTALHALENAAGIAISPSFGILRIFMRGFDNITGLPYCFLTFFK